MMQENYIAGVNQFGLGKNKYKLAKDIAFSLSQGDVIENYIYGNQNWNIHETHGYYSCVQPSYLLEKHLSKHTESAFKRNINGDLKSEVVKARKYMLGYPSDLNRTSIKKINKKNIIKMNEFFRNMDINDYVYIDQLIRNLLENDKINACVKLLNGYRITLDDIEKMLKVDKMKTTKTVIGLKQKKEFTKKMENIDLKKKI